MKASLITLILLIAIPVLSLRAQEIKVCTTHRDAPPKLAIHWRPNTLIRVYLVKDMFTPQERDVLFNAFKIWTNAAQKVEAEVSFVYGGDSEGPAICDYCLTIGRKEFKKSQNIYAMFSPSALDADYHIRTAAIDLDFGVKNSQALLGIMLHELGHGMGLADCNHCKKKQTIMRGPPSIDRDNGLTEPSACDLEVVRRIYHPDRNTEGGNSHASR